ncbi:MAG: ATP-binding protein [Candidatus Thermoplasmatota archaeon]
MTRSVSARRFAVVGGATLAYTIAYVLLAPVVGHGVESMSAVVALIVGYSLGYALGMIAAVPIFSLSLALQWLMLDVMPFGTDDLVYGAVVVSLTLAGAYMRRLRDEQSSAGRAAEGARREAEALAKQYRELIEHAPDLILIHVNGVIQYANKAAADMLHADSPKALVGTQATDLVTPEMRIAIADRVRRLTGGERLAPIRVSLQVGGRPGCLVEANSLMTEWEGQPAMLTLGRDVTENVRQVDALRDSEQLLAHTQEIANIGVWRLTPGAGIVCSTTLRKMMGLSPGNTLSRDELATIVSEDDVERLLREAATGRHGNGTAHTVTRFTRPDGETRWVRIHIHRELSPPESAVLYGIAQDVTEQYQADLVLARSQRLSSLGTLVAGVAHEINNPLTFMRGNIDLAELGIRDAIVSPQRAPELLASVQASHATVLRGIDRISSITRSLKQLARAEDAPMTLVDPNTLAGEIVAVTKARTSRNVVMDVELGAKGHVLGSATQLSQIMLNLMLNALDVVGERPDGRVTIRTRDLDGDMLLEVEDNGPGILPEHESKMFTPFFTTKPEGTGLGLALSRSIAQHHDGDLTFTSTPGRGTTFTLRLPRATPAAEQGDA